jgi:hypothetical protein
MPDFTQPGMGADMVKPGGWAGALDKIRNFGGVADAKRSRTMTQIQYDLHAAKGQTDVENNRTKQIDTASAKAAGETTLLEQSARIGLSTAKKYASAKVGKDTRPFEMVNGKKTRVGDDKRKDLHRVVATTRVGKVSVQGQKLGNQPVTDITANPITTTPPNTPNTPSGGKPNTSAPGSNPATAGKPRIKKTTAKKPKASKPGLDGATNV